MNWYKQATSSLIDNAMVAMATSDNRLSLVVFGKRYDYELPPNLSAVRIDNDFRSWKKWKNKNAAGQKVSALLKTLDPYRIQHG